LKWAFTFFIFKQYQEKLEAQFLEEPLVFSSLVSATVNKHKISMRTFMYRFKLITALQTSAWLGTLPSFSSWGPSNPWARLYPR
jgi:hypothetical protein